MTPSLDRDQEKAIALAGLFQAATLVQQIARTGSSDPEAFKALLNSIFALDPANIAEVYTGVSGVKLGLDSLLQVLKQKRATQFGDALRYSIAILQVEKLLKRDPDINSVLRSRLEQITNQLPHFEGITDYAIIEKLNDLYLDTLAKFKFRIQVNGVPQHLQQDRNAAKIRACLLAGVRSAMLWRQLGGSRLQLAIGRRKLIQNLVSLQEMATLS